jgi:hypothetical protein
MKSYLGIVSPLFSASRFQFFPSTSRKKEKGASMLYRYLIQVNFTKMMGAQKELEQADQQKRGHTPL